jgi:hypothetical protein
MDASPPRNPWLVLGLSLGVLLVLVPFVVTIVSVTQASDVPGGFRQATITVGKEGQVGRALGGASLSAILIPPGVLLTVFSGLALMSERRKSRLQRPGSSSSDSNPAGAAPPS